MTFTCSAFSRGCEAEFRRVTRLGRMRTMWAPLLIRARAFTETQSAGLSTLHVQRKCFPFKGGASLTEAMLESESSAALLSTDMCMFCGNTATTNSVVFAAGVISVVAATGWGGAAEQELPRVALAQSASCSVHVL